MNDTDNFHADQIPTRPRILVIKLRSIGDVIYNTAVYSPIKEKWPDSHLTVVVEPPAFDLVKDHPDVDEVLCFKKGSFLDQLRFYFRLYRSRYDMAIDMHEGPRAALMCFLTRARFRIGHKLAKRSFLYNVKISFLDLQPEYPVDYQVALIRKMGVEVEEPKPRVVVSDSAKDRARQILLDHGIEPQDDYCILHPGARIYDQWQADKFAELIRRVQSVYGFKTILTCGPGQERQVEAVLRNVDRTPFIMTGLQELGAMSQGARFVVCHNGGYMHLAAVLGAPVIAMFGWANPAIWKPHGPRTEVIYKNLECSPCNKKTRKKECWSGDAECKRLITVDDVMRAIESILSAKMPG